MTDSYPGEDERVRLMHAKDDADCEAEGHAEGEYICIRCGKPLIPSEEPFVEGAYVAKMLRREARWREHVREGGD